MAGRWFSLAAICMTTFVNIGNLHLEDVY
jgi:hypothetical protein